MISEDKFRELFIHYGLEPTKLKEGDIKSPDFAVKKNDKIKFYCEVKSIEKDAWPDDELTQSENFKIVSTLRNDPTFNTISAHIHKATRQLNSVNPDMNVFNVIGFYNQNSSCDWCDLISTITGNFYADNGKSYGIYKNVSGGRIKTDLQYIHLIIWLDEGAKPKFLFGENTSELASLFNIEDKDITKKY